MQDVQNLRKSIYECVSLLSTSGNFTQSIYISYKLKVDACEKGSSKERKLRGITVNYL